MAERSHCLSGALVHISRTKDQVQNSESDSGFKLVLVIKVVVATCTALVIAFFVAEYRFIQRGLDLFGYEGLASA